MKLTTGILAITITMMAGVTAATNAAAQNPDAIDNARSIAKSLQQKQANDSNAALDAAGVTAAKPAPGAPAPAVKPAVIPGSQAAAKPASKPAAKAAEKSASASSQHNQLQHVNVVPAADSIQIELSSSEAVTPRVSKLSSPARILVELPGTIAATTQNHITVGNGGVKGVRIGTDGKTPPTTSVVVDLDKAITYDLTPGTEGKLVLTLHTSGAEVASAKSTAAPAKASAATKTASKPAQVQSASAAGPSTAKLVTTSNASAAKLSSTKSSSASASSSPSSTAKPAVAAKTAAVPAAKPTVAAAQPATKATVTQTPVSPAGSLAGSTSADAKPAPKEDKKWAMNGKRDPFFSPVVQQPTGSGCSTGKKCLEIGNINLRGVVKSDAGFIAVVTNSLNKAYFLRENDPVFNGYVVKITGDSVVFQETVADKLGKPFTREVVKRIFTPAV
jgi:AMIN domain